MPELYTAQLTPPNPLEMPPDTTGRVELIIDPVIQLSEQVRNSAGTDRENLVGFSIENSAEGYTVLDGGLHQNVDRMTEKSVGLPRWYHEGGGAKLRRPRVQTMVRQRGLPRRVANGRILTFERRDEALPGTVEEADTVIIARYDPSTGEPTAIEEHPRDKFYDMVDGLGNGDLNEVKASWAPKIESVDRYGPDITITGRGTNGQPITVFEEISQKLLDRGITNWTGITWKRGNLKQEIIWDDALRKRAVTGIGSQWPRIMTIKTTVEGHTLKIENMIERQFATFISNANASGGNVVPLEGIHMTRRKTAEEVARDREEARLRALGHTVIFLATRPEDTERGRQHRSELEAHIDSQIDEGPEKIMIDDEDERRAVWLLNDPDLLDEDARLDNMETMLNSQRGRWRIETLKTVIHQEEIVTLCDTAVKLRAEYLASMKKLNLPVSPYEQSLSRVFEAIADSLITDPELLTDSEHSKRQQVALVDRLVSLSAFKIVDQDRDKAIFDKFLIQLRRRPVPDGKINSLGQLTFSISESLDLNEAFFTRYDIAPISRAERRETQKKMDFRKPVESIAKTIYEKIKRGEMPTLVEFEMFGRLLRSTIGE